MADLSSLFGAQRTEGQRFNRRNPFGGASGKAQQYKRQIVMREAMQRDISPEDGPDFFKYVGRRLFELGDMEGALAVGQKQEEYAAGLAASQQQQLQNDLDIATHNRAETKLDWEMNQPGEPTKSRSIRRGTNRVEQEWNGSKWVDIPGAVGPAFAPPSNININTGSDIGTEIQAIADDPNIPPELKPQLVEAAVSEASATKASDTAATLTGSIEALDTQLSNALTAYESAVERIRTKRVPTWEDKERLDTARSNVVLALAGRTNPRGEPSGPVLDEAERIVPATASIKWAGLVNQDVAGAFVDQVRKQFGLSGAGAASTGPVTISSDAEWEALTPGTVYIAPDGSQRVKQ